MAKKATRRKPAPEADHEEVERLPVVLQPEPRELQHALHHDTGDDEANKKQVKSLMTKDSPRRRQIILDTLSKGLSYQHAANLAVVSRRLIFMWREADAAFNAACETAHQAGIDLMEDEALRRAVQGVEKPVYQQGMLVGYVREYSDRLLEMNLKARRPERWRENYEEKRTGNISLNITEDDKDLL